MQMRSAHTLGYYFFSLRTVIMAVIVIVDIISCEDAPHYKR